ncbi:MAG: flagellar hook-basal body complex protein FliE [Bacillota bacterium]|nr:flagellar hook-basal body complex protein FliE [Bacillota bacterium]
MSSSGVRFDYPAVAGGVRPGEEATVGRAGAGEQGKAAPFAEMLKTALGQVNAALKESDAAAERLATGEATNLHEVVLATERANLALQLTMAIRNKILEAYNELMRMQV